MLSPNTGAFQERILNEMIQAAEHVLHQFCQPAFFRYHNPEERIGSVHQMDGNLFTVQATHLQYNYHDISIELSLLERQTIMDRLNIFRYFAGPFYNFVYEDTVLTRSLPFLAACHRLRQSCESLLSFEDAMLLHAWAKHINIIDRPTVTWSDEGELVKYVLDRYRGPCPINLFGIFADGETPNGARDPYPENLDDLNFLNRRWQRQATDDRSLTVETVVACRQAVITDINPDAAPKAHDEDTEAFIAEIDALMAEEDNNELPEEGTLPKSAPTG